MSKSSFIYFIQIFLLIIISAYLLDKIVYVCINSFHNQVFTGQKSGGKANQFLKQKDNLDFLIFGSSRANRHIDPTNFATKSFNMGLDGIKIAYSATLIKALPKNKKQTVLLHISPKNSFDTLYLGEDVAELSKFYHTNSVIKKEIITLNQDKFLQKIFWCQIYNNSALGIIKNFLFPQYNYQTYYGYDPIYVTKEQHENFKIISDNWESKICSQNLILNPIYEKYLIEIKEFCKKNNKHLILFTAPIYKDDCKNDDLALSLKLEEDGYIYWNYSDFFKNDNSLLNWKDNTHLSNIGAEIFTEEIKKKLTSEKALD